MILHHAVVWTTLVVGAIGVAAAENSTALIRRSMQEEIDYSTCDEVVATIGDLTSETAIRVALQDTVIATEQQRTIANDGDRLSFACTAWVGLGVRLAAAQALHECLPRCHVFARCLPMVYVSVAQSAATVTSSPRVLVIVKPLLSVPHGWLCCLLCNCASGLMGWVWVRASGEDSP